MKKNVIKIIIGLVTIIIVAVILVVINNSYTSKTNQTSHEPVYKESKIKQLKLKSITTKDKNILIDDTVVYFTLDNRISQLDLEIKSKTSLEELYLLIEFELDKKVEKNKEFQYMIQSIEDLTKTKKWKVSKITEKEAVSNGYIKIED